MDGQGTSTPPAVAPRSRPGETAPRAHGFLCYSRKDSEFAAALVAEINKSHERTLVFDIEGLRGGEAWRRKLQNLIEHSDNVVFLISEDSLASQYCRWELDYANTHNKRLIPVLVRPTGNSEIPESVKAIQWIDATTRDVPSTAAAVVTAMQEDQAWAEYHTQLELRAATWKAKQGALLRRSELKTAESMVLQYEGRRPKVTELQSAFLVDSRRAAQRRAYWLTTALIAAAALAGFGGNAWLHSQEERGQRLLSDSAAALRARDLASAMPPLEQLLSPGALTAAALRAVPPTWLRSVENLRRFWLPQLVSLSEVTAQLPAPGLAYLNDHPSVKLASSELVPLTAMGYFRLVRSTTPDGLVFADATRVRVHDPSTFEVLLDVPADKRSYASRSGVKEVYSAHEPDLVIVVTEAVVVNNDEDEPESLFQHLYVVYQSPKEVEPTFCSEADSADSHGCHPVEPALRGQRGLAAASIPVGENYRVESIGITGKTVLVRATVACEYWDECERRPKVTHLSLTLNGGKLSVSDADAELLASQPWTEVMAAPGLPEVHFPRARDESAFWASVVAPAAEPLPPSTPQRLEFSRLVEADHYERVFATPGRVLPGDGHGVVWNFTDGGNSWDQISRCRFDRAGVVIGCDDKGFTAIASERIESPDHRFVAQRNCNTADPSVTLFDLVRWSEGDVEIPSSPVLGIAFSPNSDRFALLTDQHGIWLYDTQPGQAARLTQKISLPGQPRPTNHTDCLKGQPLTFFTDDQIIGVDRGPFLFAADAESGRVLWMTNSTTPESLSLFESATTFTNDPGHGYFALWGRQAVQMFDADSGTPLTFPVEPLASLKGEDGCEEPWFDAVDLDQDGQITVRCPLCNERVFIRAAPRADDGGCSSLELLAGQDAAGQRLGPGELIDLHQRQESCRARNQRR